jgi:regulator-associated protein of mTOR
MVSSFRALNEVIQLQKGSGLVFDWKQSIGNLLVGGDSRVIKVWDAQTETQNLVGTAAKNALSFLLMKFR